MERTNGTIGGLKNNPDNPDQYESIRRKKISYGIEAEIKDKSIEQREEVRQKSAKVILIEIKSWLDGSQDRYPLTRGMPRLRNR